MPYLSRHKYKICCELYYAEYNIAYENLNQITKTDKWSMFFGIIGLLKFYFFFFAVVHSQHKSKIVGYRNMEVGKGKLVIVSIINWKIRNLFKEII